MIALAPPNVSVHFTRMVAQGAAGERAPISGFGRLLAARR